MLLKYVGSAALVFAIIGGGWYVTLPAQPTDMTRTDTPGTPVTSVTNGSTASDTDDTDATDDDDNNDDGTGATQPVASGSCVISRDLSWGSKGTDVVCLQKALIAAGHAIPSGPTGYFGPETTAAVTEWQKTVGVTQSGYFGSQSRVAFGGGSVTNTGTTAPSAATSFTLADVAAHAGRASCWSAINGVVYDLTSWIDKHPGGANRILSICGKDGSPAFDQQHAGEPRPEAMLATFKLGTLK